MLDTSGKCSRTLFGVSCPNGRASRPCIGGRLASCGGHFDALRLVHAAILALSAIKLWTKSANDQGR
jgi:hypothetical protein